jgi:hypothetical protein
MSRSKRNAPVTGLTTAASEKEWKRESNRKLRRATTQIVQQMPFGDPDAIVLPLLAEVANQYSGPKDGKHRFDPRRYPHLLRK